MLSCKTATENTKAYLNHTVSYLWNITINYPWIFNIRNKNSFQWGILTNKFVINKRKRYVSETRMKSWLGVNDQEAHQFYKLCYIYHCNYPQLGKMVIDMSHRGSVAHWCGHGVFLSSLDNRKSDTCHKIPHHKTCSVYHKITLWLDSTIHQGPDSI